MAEQLGGGAVAAITIVVVQAGAALVGQCCPNWWSVRDGETDQRSVNSIRQGYSAAGALTIAAGLAAGYAVRSPLPVLGALLITGLEIAGYEYSIRHPA